MYFFLHHFFLNSNNVHILNASQINYAFSKNEKKCYLCLLFVGYMFKEKRHDGDADPTSEESFRL